MALIQSLNYHRPTPHAWVIGGMGLDRSIDLAKDLRDLKTVFLVRAINKKEILEALRSGRMYVARGGSSGSFVLDSFTARDAGGGEPKTMGEELVTSGQPAIEIRGHFMEAQESPIKVRLNRDGMVIKTFEEISPLSISYQDEFNAPRKKNYYRVEI